MERKNAWEKYREDADKKKVFDFAEGYRQFISNNKTERECTTFFVERLDAAGYVNLDDVIANNKSLKAGDKVYAVNKTVSYTHLRAHET